MLSSSLGACVLEMCLDRGRKTALQYLGMVAIRLTWQQFHEWLYFRNGGKYLERLEVGELGACVVSFRVYSLWLYV